MDANVGVVILNKRKRRILLVKNEEGWKQMPSGKRFFKPSRWGLPNGRRRSSEGITATAKRETEEETGFLIKIEPGLKIENNFSDYRNITFLGHIIGGELQDRSYTHKIIDCRWFPIQVLRDRVFNMHFSHRTKALMLLEKLGL